MKKNLLTILTTICCIILVVSQNVSAEEINYKDYIKVTNSDTQEEVDIEIKEVTKKIRPVQSTLLRSSTSNKFIEDVEIEFNIPELEGISLASNIDTTKNHGDFKAYLRFDYETAGTINKPKIRVSSVQGYWKSTATSYSVSFQNREVILKQGNWLYDKCTLVKKPKENRFYSNTYWDYVYDLPKTDYSGVYAESTAKAVISGMSGGYTLVAKISK